VITVFSVVMLLGALTTAGSVSRPGNAPVTRLARGLLLFSVGGLGGVFWDEVLHAKRDGQGLQPATR
jgi:hypothetical protein